MQHLLEKHQGLPDTAQKTEHVQCGLVKTTFLR